MDELKKLYEDNKKMLKPVLIMLLIGLVLFFGESTNV